MKFFCDSYFHIGQAHLTNGKPCQDYALADNKMAYAIVSDGCSSGGRTDIGARITALATATAIDQAGRDKNIFPLEQFFYQIDQLRDGALEITQATLGVTPHDLLATCMSIVLTADGGYARVEGDGVVAIKYRTGAVRMFRFDWKNNMPFYPVYRKFGLQSFMQAHESEATEECLREEVWLCDAGGQCVQEKTLTHSVQEGVTGIRLFIEREDIETEIECVAVFSDGVCQIDGTSWQKAVGEFLAFKNVAGEFAKRRMIRGIRDMCKIGRGPIDDLAYAVIRIEPEQEEIVNENIEPEGVVGRTQADNPAT